MELWFQDEARVGQKNGLVYQWGRRGARPRQPQDQRHASAYIFGAVCPARAEGAALVLPRADTEAMQLHLEEISRMIAPGAHGVVVMDKAGWHTTAALKVPDNLSILYLPPYSPELNPHENIWQYLRQTYLPNRVFDGYEAIVEACCKAWNALLAEADRITSTQPEPGLPSVSNYASWYHIFYAARVFDMDDRLPKWAGHRDISARLG